MFMVMKHFIKTLSKELRYMKVQDNSDALFPFRIVFDGRYIVRQCMNVEHAKERAVLEFGENNQYEISKVE